MAEKLFMIREDIQQTKLEKLARIREYGMDPYPEKSERNFRNANASEKFEEFAGRVITLAGRVRSMRPMGGSAFANIEDESGKMQLFLNKANMPEELFLLFTKNVELGDFVQVTGELFLTKTEEKSLKVIDWKMLSKNIRPIPTEHFGIKDEEELLRKRYLDLMTNPETRELFRKKNIFWQTIRTFLARFLYAHFT
ncbi:MAG: Lysine-tRNA ligase [Candidatus Moranbacteria bacterium GW2011_GWD1_36_198]|nr:MAG: Lysine-tRNA ligase [Candidatus Moranbacteria bacterium GW2011_GWD1_36_198]